MERDIISRKLTEIFREVFNDQALELDDDLTANDVDNWDSLTHMLLVTEVEKVFQVKFKLKELNKMRNVGDLITLIASKV